MVVVDCKDALNIVSPHANAEGLRSLSQTITSATAPFTQDKSSS